MAHAARALGALMAGIPVSRPRRTSADVRWYNRARSGTFPRLALDSTNTGTPSPRDHAAQLPEGAATIRSHREYSGQPVCTMWQTERGMDRRVRSGQPDERVHEHQSISLGLYSPR